jgi:hypothetical protein
MEKNRQTGMSAGNLPDQWNNMRNIVETSNSLQFNCLAHAQSRQGIMQ